MQAQRGQNRCRSGGENRAGWRNRGQGQQRIFRGRSFRNRLQWPVIKPRAAIAAFRSMPNGQAQYVTNDSPSPAGGERCGAFVVPNSAWRARRVPCPLRRAPTRSVGREVGMFLVFAHAHAHGERGQEE